MMSVEEFRQIVESGKLIRCNNKDERNSVLEFMVAHGFNVNRASLEYLNGVEDNHFLHPGLIKNRPSNMVCCYAGYSDYEYVPYRHVEDLISSYAKQILDERSDRGIYK